MKLKKLFAGFLMVTVLSLSAVTAFGADSGDLKLIRTPISNEEIERSHFNSFTGTVEKIADFEWGGKFVSVKSEEGAPANIIVSDSTYILDNAEIVVGSKITAFYDANAPMIMIYPPQYNAKVVAVENKDRNIKVDFFNQDLISADHMLKLNISDRTEVISQDGKVFKGQLGNKNLVVVYDVSTRSIPAQTNPIKVVVLFEEEVPDVSKMEIVVNNEKIDAPAAYADKQGNIMVPLRAIAEALNFELGWDGEVQRIILGKDISLTIGEDNYVYGATSSLQLGAAPVLIEGRTFVPLSFFKQVVEMNNAYVFEGQIVIDNGEIMN
jgi:hypothetical protein